MSREMITSGKSYMKNPAWNNDMIDEKTGYGVKVLVVTERVDTNLDDVYYKAIHNISKETVGDLKLKKAKLKLCSDDKKMGFGWTKNVFGRKKWGFFKPQKPIKENTSAITQ